MPPKRRKQAFDHDAVVTGRSKIRRRHGVAAVDSWTPQKVLLYLNKLPQDAAKDYGQGPFQNALNTAVTDAVDKGMGPNALIDLEGYIDGERDRIAGNQAAGELIGTLLGQIDGGGSQRLADLLRDKEVAETRVKEAEEALAYLQDIVPIKPKEALAFTVTNLVRPINDADWAYGILWNSALWWMDARLRSMRSHLQHVGNAPQEPPSLAGRMRMVNYRIHGGNIRVDALMCKIRFGVDRHLDGNYDVYISESFRRIYEMSVEDGYWLAKHGDTVARGIDWGSAVGLIDKYISCRDSVAEWRVKPPNYAATHTAFQEFTRQVARLIGLARASPTWEASSADIASYTQSRQEVINFCSYWVQGFLRIWTAFTTVQPHWPFADYLRDVWTQRQREIPKSDGATINLRPQPRVKYSR